jgi:LmbE family N-acetylglucosaminyl deacetylase
MKKILIIAAHPDDEVLGCGGLIAKYINSAVRFRILFIGEGSSCRFSNPLDAEASSAISLRNESAKKAMKLLGVEDFQFFNLACGRLDQVPIIEINKLIESEIDSFKPDSIYTHSIDDANNDHQIVFRATLMATRPCAFPFVERVLSYEVPSSSEFAYTTQFAPNIFEELSFGQLSIKWQALQCYESEIRPFPFPRSERGIETLAMYRGMQCGATFAEGYKLIREYRR